MQLAFLFSWNVQLKCKSALIKEKSEINGKAVKK